MGMIASEWRVKKQKLVVPWMSSLVGRRDGRTKKKATNEGRMSEWDRRREKKVAREITYRNIISTSFLIFEVIAWWARRKGKRSLHAPNYYYVMLLHLVKIENETTCDATRPTNEQPNEREREKSQLGNLAQGGRGRGDVQSKAMQL